jgi:integrase
MLYGLQQRDVLGRRIAASSIRQIVRGMPQVTTMLGQEGVLDELLAQTRNAQAAARQISWSLKIAFDEFRGVAATDKDQLDLRAAGLKSKDTLNGRRINAGVADLTTITQPWLRLLLRRWVEAERPVNDRFGRTLRAVELTSGALITRTGGGLDPAVLGYADMTVVVDAFRTAHRLDGQPYAAKSRRTILGALFALLDFGRKAGLLDEVPGSFAPHSSHSIPDEDPNEEEIGSAIPEHVIAQLDANVGSIGQAVGSYGALNSSQVLTMFQTVYVLLRDTGRRPNEVASLRRDCLEIDGGEISLIWDNDKGKRLRRRLPITEDTAEAVRHWQALRERIAAPPRSHDYLFPAKSDAAGKPHLATGYITMAIRGWVDALPELHSDVIGPGARLLAFERSRVFPYAFRHSYAQPHADAGTPVDVLKELMDHVSVETTMGYYTVSLKRKQRAVKTLAAQAVDRTGRPAPFGSGLAYQRSSVAVPFGGCTELSNIKAGGKACPIRFQCAGCPFYRPDPSYLPAIEQQINDLRSDRETAEAMEAADYVITNLTDQVHAYSDVAAKMRKNLAELPADERAEIEEASAIMRKARATSAHTLLPLTTVSKDGER